MSAYYLRRRPASVSRTSSRTGEDRDRERDENASAADLVPADGSIYIFPNPSTTFPFSPSSPSSPLSAPTDFDPSDSFSFSSRSRSRSTGNRPGERSPAAESGAALTQSWSRYASPIGDDEVEIDIDIWELEFGLGSELDTRDDSWTLEHEVERISSGDIDLSLYRASRSAWRSRPPSESQPPQSLPSTAPPAQPQLRQSRWSEWERTTRPHRRARTQSRIRTLSSLSAASALRARSSPTAPPKPHPRTHIPLLSLFASLLAVDLDDPALRLLTRADPGDDEAILFPGHTTAQLLSGSEDSAQGKDGRKEENGDVREDADGEKAGAEGEEVHGLQRLLLASFSDQSTVALRALRNGLAVCVPSSASGLPIPSPTALLGLWRAAGEVCMRGGETWLEVLRSATATRTV